MAKRIAMIASHGMGDTDPNYGDPLSQNLKSMLGADNWGKIHFDSIWYRDILQPHQEALFERSKSQLDGMFLRRFLLNGISDAAGLESPQSYRVLDGRRFPASASNTSQ